MLDLNSEDVPRRYTYANALRQCQAIEKARFSLGKDKEHISSIEGMSSHSDMIAVPKAWRNGSQLTHNQRWVKFALRFSKKARMPSFRSSTAKVE